MIVNHRFWPLDTFKQFSWKNSFLEFVPFQAIFLSNAPGLLPETTLYETGFIQQVITIHRGRKCQKYIYLKWEY